MWNDVETTKDLLNFTVVAKTAAQLVKDSNGEPISIGVSGNWGTGKSSLVKMIGAELQKSDADKRYVFLEFNAWLYQGYDDARMALLQSVADRLLTEAEQRMTFIDKAQEFVQRVNWLRVGKLLVPVATGAVFGGAIAGPIGAVIGAVGGLFKADGATPRPEDIEKLREAYASIKPELSGLLNEKTPKSLPQEIQELRGAFNELLTKLNITLVILVDDLDRCLPPTAISTLEAMRLLLFLPRTAFIIAADDQMIRNAVRAHFSDIELSDDLVTNYFDKLIQVPLRVPRLGITEIKGYLVLLLAEQAMKKGTISLDALNEAEACILQAVNRSWAGGLTRKIMFDAFGKEASKVSAEINLADQLAGIMVSADRISGNPRLIKRFLNNLMICDSVAKAQNLTISFDQLVKIQLLERCSPKSFEYLVKRIAEREDGKAPFIAEIETCLSKGESFTVPDVSWDSSFISDWMKLNPMLGDVDLRPLIYLSRERTISLANFDEISSEGRALLDGLLASKTLMQPLAEQVKGLGELECERILNRIMRQARSKQWDVSVLRQALHITMAFPNLGPSYVNYLNEIPALQRPPSLIPLIKDEGWAKDLLVRWENDSSSPLPVKRAISLSERK